MTKRAAPSTQLGRLAMRAEGEDWTAYYALPGTMDGAIFLGTVRMAIVTRDPARKEIFMGLMREAVADIIEDACGERPTWGGPKVAPEHERSGRA